MIAQLFDTKQTKRIVNIANELTNYLWLLSANGYKTSLPVGTYTAARIGKEKLRIIVRQKI